MLLLFISSCFIVFLCVLYVYLNKATLLRPDFYLNLPVLVALMHDVNNSDGFYLNCESLDDLWRYLFHLLNCFDWTVLQNFIFVVDGLVEWCCPFEDCICDALIIWCLLWVFMAVVKELRLTEWPEFMISLKLKRVLLICAKPVQMMSALLLQWLF